MTLYKSRYRAESTRFPTYDYSSNGYYFVTICTHQKYCYFGKIINTKMQLSKLGKIVQKNWQGIPERFNGVDIDEYVIMPNHVHEIIMINSTDKLYRDIAFIENI